MVKTYLEFALRKLFAGAWEGKSVVYDPLPVHVPAPPAAHVQQVLAMLQAAERPVLLMGSQSMLDAGKADELQKAILKLGIPTFLGGMSRGLLGRNNKQHIRQNRRVALKKADLVIMAGAIADFRLDYGRVLVCYAVLGTRNGIKASTARQCDKYTLFAIVFMLCLR